MLADWRAAPIPEGLRLTLGLLQRLALDPGAVGPANVAPLRAAGVSDDAIRDALYVSALFHVISRVADALGFVVLSPEEFAARAPAFLEGGYVREA